MRRLQAIPVDQLKRHASGLRLQALKDAGLHTLADLQGWPANRLIRIRGVGPDSAARIANLVHELTNQSNRQPIPHPWPATEHGPERPLLEAICHLGRAESWLEDPNRRLPAITASFRNRMKEVRAKTTFLNWLWGFGSHPAIAAAITDSNALELELQGDNEPAQILREFSQCLENIAIGRRSGLPWSDLSAEMNAHPDFYTRHVGSLLVEGNPSLVTQSLIRPPSNTASVSTGSSPITRPRSTPTPATPSLSVQSQGPLKPVIELNGDSTSFRTSDSYHPRPQPIQRDSSAYWIPPGQDVSVKGFLLRGGMVYIGEDLSSVRDSGLEPSLINPSLAIQNDETDCHVRRMDYWPCYDGITAEARASYLQWLSTGKSDPKADIGYVFLYFYGLERRVLWDTAHDPSVEAELPHIEQEIRRLICIYSQSGSFRGYATSLLELMKARRGVVNGASILVSNTTRDLNFELRYGLGQFAQNGEPLQANWALSWYLADPSTRLHTAAQRCPDFFGVIFRAEFSNRFPDGLKLAINKTQLKVSHRPASASFGGEVFTTKLDIPDVTVLSAPVQILQQIGETSSAVLEPYSRFVGRNPGQESSLEALLLLPAGFWPELVRQPLFDLRDEVKKQNRPQMMRLVDLQLLLPEGAEFTKTRFTSLCRALGNLGLGIEPDVRFGGTLPDVSDYIVLFAAQGLENDVCLTGPFNSATLLLHLASAVAAADGDFDEAEAQMLLDHIQHALELPSWELCRLQARLALFRKAPPGLTGLKKRIDCLSQDARKTLGGFLIRLVQTDDSVNPRELRTLEKIFKLLNLNIASIHSELHSAATEPVAVRPISESTPSFRIPEPPKARSATDRLQLDMAKIAALKADSAKVSLLLGSIFAESQPTEAEEPNVPTQTLDDGPASPLGLDPDHNGLLQVMLQRPQWSRIELEEICADRGLMIDGALERINEAAFECFGQPLIEGDDPIDMNRDLMLEEVA